MAAATETPDLPQCTKTYQSHHFAAEKWDDVIPRDDDIVISTAYKAGTTWMQQIVAQLVFQGENPPDAVPNISPWVDLRVPPREVIMPMIEGMTHRRFLKTHLPLDGVPFHPQVKYI